MDVWEWRDKPIHLRGIKPQPQPQHVRDRNTAIATPSFSSSLLDAIYRSIDGETDDAAAKKPLSKVDAMTNLFPPKKLPSIHLRRPTPPSVAPRRRSADRRVTAAAPSTSSSSDSSYGGFSSSEPDSARAPPIPPQVAVIADGAKKSNSIRSRFRQSKIYRELKKARSPASPGARLASFLNSLFPTRPRTPAPTCSPAPPLTRSCLGRPPPPPSVGARSVRFDLPPPPPVRVRPAEETDRPQEAKARFGLGFGQRAEEDDDDEVASYSSSDLFELDDLDGFGGERYRDELPVYGTTHVGTISRGHINDGKYLRV